MSPKRKVDEERENFLAGSEIDRVVTPRWGLPLTSVLAMVVVASAVIGSVLILTGTVSRDRSESRSASALFYVRGFMTDYTTLDPFHANDYADRILAQGTGDFAKTFKEKMNEIVVRVARAEPTTGVVQEAGLQRWNADDSADILVATIVRSTTPDEDVRIENGTRWLVTTVEEGQQWKIAQLIQVI